MMVRRLVLLCLLLAGCGGGGGGAPRVESPLSEAPQSPLFVAAKVVYAPLMHGGPPPPMCLPAGLGVGMPRQDPINARSTELAAMLRASWWHDWSYGVPASGVDARQVLVWWGPVVRVDGQVSAAVAAQDDIPCRPLLMGNEPDGWNDSVSLWAGKMKEFERASPAAYWGCCGTIINEAGFAWLARYFAAGGPVPDVWHMHLYPLWCPPDPVRGDEPCADDAERMERLAGMLHGWYTVHGRGLPIIITEFGGSDSGPDQDALAMRWGAAWLKGETGPATRPVAMAWFSSRYLDHWQRPPVAMYPRQWLVGEDGGLTALGRQFREIRSGTEKGPEKGATRDW